MCLSVGIGTELEPKFVSNLLGAIDGNRQKT